MCENFPESASHHNNLAWFAANCHRELDVALDHSQRAIRLRPDRAAYHDTLAEIHFRRGDRDQAVEAIKRSVALEPENDFYGQRLKRFESEAIPKRSFLGELPGIDYLSDHPCSPINCTNRQPESLCTQARPDRFST